MAADDLLYDKIKSPDGTKRIVSRRLNDYIDVVFEVTTCDGEDVWQITTIVVTSGGPPATKVVVDSKTIIDPHPPVYNDDGCYARELRGNVNENSQGHRWTPSDFGFVGC